MKKPRGGRGPASEKKRKKPLDERSGGVYLYGGETAARKEVFVVPGIGQDKQKNNPVGWRPYFLISLLLALLTNRLLFPLGHWLGGFFPRHDLSLPADARIPLLPWTILIYFGVFVWWFFVFLLVARRDRRTADRFFCANMLAKGICLLFYIFFPTDMSRPELSGSSVWILILRFLYRVDTPDNLFPSIHCLLGWLCWIGVRGRKEYPFAVRAASFLLGAAVCLSTLTVRQHVLADVAAGILLAELCWLLADRPGLRGGYARLVAWLAGPFERKRAEK